MNATTFAARQQARSRVDQEAARLAKTKLVDLFAADSTRVTSLTFEAPHLIADFSKQRFDDAALSALNQLADAADFDGWRAKMFAGEIVNNTEQRPAMHWALRAHDAPPEVKATRAKMAAFAKDIRPQIDAIIHLGIGGSDLGPRLLIDTFKPLRHNGLDVRFAANVDGADIVDAIDGLNPERTLLIVVSKTFTTQETLANANFVKTWKPKFIAAATAAPDKATAWGVPDAQIFPFWDWVGGRYSLWSSVSLVCVVAWEEGAFDRFLAGAAEMDGHFKSMPFAQNLPAVSAAVQMWNREWLHHGSYAIIPYAERLRLLPSYLQQLEMESNGKHVTREGEPLEHSSCGVTWGSAGTNGQHSFFQLLHQGVQEIPVEILVNAGPEEGPADHRAKLLANALAQARALMVGKSMAQARNEMVAKDVDVGEADRLAPHRAFAGDRATTIMAFDALSPEAIGALLAFYEHRTFTQGILADINSFDQWGVELGKEMANQLAPTLEGGPLPDLDPSTVAWVKRLRR